MAKYLFHLLFTDDSLLSCISVYVVLLQHSQFLDDSFPLYFRTDNPYLPCIDKLSQLEGTFRFEVVKLKIDWTCASVKLLDSVQIAFQIASQSVRIRYHLATWNGALDHHPLQV